jgi:hypothetical protein
MTPENLRPGIAAIAFAALAALAAPAAAQAPDDGKGRFTMSPIDGGFLRLDTQTGDVSLCTKSGAAWTCEPVKDRGSAVEALQEENRALKEHIKSLEEGMAADKGGSGGGSSGDSTTENGYPTAPPAGSTTKLPTEKDIDQAFDYVERMYKKLRERIEQLDKMPPPKSSDGAGDNPDKAL